MLPPGKLRILVALACALPWILTLLSCDSVIGIEALTLSEKDAGADAGRADAAFDVWTDVMQESQGKDASAEVELGDGPAPVEAQASDSQGDEDGDSG